ncbi:Kv channel-interacting protein 4-like protein [Aphelenchoides avenae]|nr:Kv channel-interacting protein 4-like protein [Aphelenchus avenae]
MAIPINEDPYRSSSSNWYYPDDVEHVPVVLYRPRSLESICELTKFSKKEVQLIYRSFKQRCPTGIISCSTFLEVYGQLFPHGDPTNYAQYVFRTFDTDDDEQISFEEFVSGLSVITRGNMDDKLNWIFNLYDLNKSGAIGQLELFAVTRSLFELHGYNPNSAATRKEIRGRTLAIHKVQVENEMAS